MIHEREYFNIVDFLGIKLGAVNRYEIVNKILEFALTDKHRMIAYLNADCLNISFKDKVYRNILNQMDMVYAGGMGIIWASRLLGKPLPCRVNILDFFDRLVNKAIEKDISFYFLGGKPGVALKATDNLKKKYSNLRIVGADHGYFDKNMEAKLIKEINTLKPNILMIGMGVPKQEKWIYEHLQELDVNLCWAIGGAFNNLSGYLKTAPSLVSKNGLEWFYRLFQEPKRLWKRYLIGNFVFIYHLLNWKLKDFISKKL